jgi:hypothetical protein
MINDIVIITPAATTISNTRYHKKKSNKFFRSTCAAPA